jgi:hypothetical protein
VGDSPVEIAFESAMSGVQTPRWRIEPKLNQGDLFGSGQSSSLLGNSVFGNSVSGDSVFGDSVSCASVTGPTSGEIELVPSTSTVDVDLMAVDPTLTHEVAAQTKIEETQLEETGIEETKIESIPEPAVSGRPAEGHRPGILLVLVSVVIASMLAGGLWWKLKNDQLSKTLVVPTEDGISKPAKTEASRTIDTAGPATPAESSTPNGLAENSDVIPSDALGDSRTLSDSVSDTAHPQGGSLPRVTGIRHWSSSDSSTVVLDLQDQVQYEAHRLNKPDRIYFDLRDTELASELSGKSIDVGDGLLARIRVAQPEPGMTRVVLETKGGSNFSVSLEPNPYRLVVQVRKIGADNGGRVDLFPDSGET